MNTILVIDHNVSGSGTCAPTWEFVVEISALTQKDSVPWTREELANLLSALKGRDNMPIAKLKDLPEVFKTSNDQEKELIAEQMNIPTKYRRSLYEGTIEIVIDSKNILYTKPELAKQMSEEITNGYITRHDRDSEYWRTGYWRQGLLGSPVQLVQANDRLVFKLDNSRSNFFFIPLG